MNMWWEYPKNLNPPPVKFDDPIGYHYWIVNCTGYWTYGWLRGTLIPKEW